MLGVYSGAATVRLGGEHGKKVEVRTGDVIVIPAGVAHQNVGASDDFGVVGAYPEGREWDLLRGLPGERPNADRNIAAFPMPDNDPIYGAKGSTPTDLEIQRSKIEIIQETMDEL